VSEKVQRFAPYSHNGRLIEAAHRLGHVRGLVLDATFGKGTWWRSAEYLTEVTGIVGADLMAHKARRARAFIGPEVKPGEWIHASGVQADFRLTPFRPRSFQTVFFDPRYKLNGTPTPDEDGPDERYGADDPKPWQEIRAEMVDGITALAELVALGGRLLAKCQNQVCSKRVRFQTDWLTDAAEAAGLEKVDQLDYEIVPRTQPEGRTQNNAESNYSTLLIFGRPPIRLRPLS
jgi:hypothetical protein